MAQRRITSLRRTMIGAAVAAIVVIGPSEAGFAQVADGQGQSGSNPSVSVPVHKKVSSSGKVRTQPRRPDTSRSDALTSASAGATWDTGGRSCDWFLDAEFNGYRQSNGNITGTWDWVASTVCSDQMYELGVSAWGSGANYVSSPYDYCSYWNDCTVVVSNGSTYCAICNAVWQFTSGHYMAFWDVLDWGTVNPNDCDVIDSWTVRCYNYVEQWLF